MVDEKGVFDQNVSRFGAPKIYQYTEIEKTRLCLDDDDYFNHLCRNFASIRDRKDQLLDHIRDLKPKYTFK